MVMLLPRLDAVEAERLIALYPATPLKNLALQSGEALPAKITFGASGGYRSSPDYLRRLQEYIVEVASKYGYPQRGSAGDRARFDEEISVFLAGQPDIASGEALRDDTWTFMTTILVPEVIYWRFGGTSERFLGGIRNALQRLWIRGTLFDRGPTTADRWELLRLLTEDAMVQITERAAIGGDPILSLATAEAWVRASGRHSKNAMEDIMRMAIIGIRLRNEYIMLARGSEGALAELLDSEFDRAAVAIKRVRTPSH